MPKPPKYVWRPVSARTSRGSLCALPDPLAAMGVPTSKGEGRKRKERRGPTYKWREERGSTSPGGWKGVKGGEKGWEENPPQSQAKGKGSPYSITERRVPELIPVLGSQPAGDVSHK